MKMTCCSNQKPTTAKEAMVDIKTLMTLVEEYTALAPKLLEIVKGGIRSVDFKNPNIKELATIIASIVAENNYLKNLLGGFHPGKAHAKEDGVTIHFGPQNEYQLFIPALTQSARTKLATSLMVAAEALQKSKPDTPEQKWLPFADCA